MSLPFNFSNGKKLRYGENPHQEGWFYAEESDDALAIQKFEMLQGKELSYNNYLDMDGALYALSHLGGLKEDFSSFNPVSEGKPPMLNEVRQAVGGQKPACVIVKHTNPCGAARKVTAEEAYQAAWYEGDPLAAFGGVMAINREVGGALAEKMIENFFEILLAPSVTEEAKAIFAKKPNLRVLLNPALLNPAPPSGMHGHFIRGGILLESPDDKILFEKDLTIAASRQPSDEELRDLLFAWAICRSTKSNTIVAAKNETLIASGAGQQDRKRCAELCVSKGGIRLKGAVSASDAFFPFPDALQVLISAGITAVIQPGGSIKDAEVIAAANEAGIAMVMTGIRAFRH